MSVTWAPKLRPPQDTLELCEQLVRNDQDEGSVEPRIEPRSGCADCTDERRDEDPWVQNGRGQKPIRIAQLRRSARSA